MIATSDSKPRKTWKEHLLKSGLLLEYEVASLLANQDMAVDADFSYLRRDSAGTKECSVDISATWFSDESSGLEFEVRLLVECKYRSPGKLFVFIEEPNREFSPITLGDTVNALDQFTPYELGEKPLTDLEATFRFAYKGIELSNDGAFNQELLHGIQQLRYATPALLRHALSFNMSLHPDDAARPIFFAKILVTNAPIRMLHSDINIQKIMEADSIESVSSSPDSVILFSDYGPDYEDHFRSTFSDSKEHLRELSQDIRERLLAAEIPLDNLTNPAVFIENLSTANRFEARALSTQFFVTSLSGFAGLIQQIKAASKASFDSRTSKRSP
ncbi:hypothetical protein LRC39_15225 [Rhodopseudomonas sp. P1]|uniref:hypothetical protein n=1 Tax=Rhodopseudomonas sp. P1 TaxID=3434357 RepID=UPI0031FD1C3F